ncbi:hypothetical protein P5673_012519 [Acropora cervicornis]|uniref:Arrestin C-terminal-like domain-containing protein n=1 Tax=Acropora cervicornis TaxID=6130 RepID=A0AAD9QN87_ACRCE|nr:hypothetical protein P5673_012519 [Acropora cervicornis]
MSMNRIAVRTNKGDYLGGEGVYGYFYGNEVPKKLLHPIQCVSNAGVKFCEWEYREVQQDEATQMPVTIVKTKQSRRDMFRAELTLIEYPGGIPMGCYAYPFHYTLQQGLPVSFNNSGNQANGDHWKAKISYKVEAEVDSPDSGEVLKDREFSGSFSSQDSRPSVAQAIRVPVIIDTITEKSHNRSQDQQLRNAEIPLDLWEAVTRIEFEPSTNGQIVKSKYHVDVEVDIPWALPISVQLPVTLRAPANHSWSDWEPPPWVFNCRVVKISGPCAVPEHLLGSKMFANIPGIQADPF